MSITLVRGTAAWEAIHATDSDFEQTLSEWLHAEEEVLAELREQIEQTEPKPWVLRAPDRMSVGLLSPANFIKEFEDVAAADALQDIWVERQRHIDLGYDAQHDDSRGLDHLVAEVQQRATTLRETLFPTDADRRNELVQTASLILAAIDKIDRAQNVRTNAGE